jgi:hypothetical protein
MYYYVLYTALITCWLACGHRVHDRMVVGLQIQLPVQSVPIITKVVNSNPFHGEVCSIQHYANIDVKPNTIYNHGLVNMVTLLMMSRESFL